MHLDLLRLLTRRTLLAAAFAAATVFATLLAALSLLGASAGVQPTFSASLAPVTVMVSVVVAEPPLPSLTV